jgi:hypothetical protein
MTAGKNLGKGKGTPVPDLYRLALAGKDELTAWIKINGFN